MPNMPLPHYGYTLPGLEYIRSLNILESHEGPITLGLVLKQLSLYKIDESDLHSVFACKTKIRNYNLEKILESI